jgi:hypothetical protein
MDSALDAALDAALIDEFDADAPAARPSPPSPPALASRRLVPGAVVHYPSFGDIGVASSEQIGLFERYPTAELDATRAAENAQRLQARTQRVPPAAMRPEAPVSTPPASGARSNLFHEVELPALQVNQAPPSRAEDGSSLKYLLPNHRYDSSATDGVGMTDAQLRARRRAVELEMREFQARVDYVALALAGQTPHQQQVRAQREHERVEREEARARYQIERLHHWEEVRAERVRERRTGADRHRSSSPPKGEAESNEESTLAVE